MVVRAWDLLPMEFRARHSPMPIAISTWARAAIDAAVRTKYSPGNPDSLVQGRGLMPTEARQ